MKTYIFVNDNKKGVLKLEEIIKEYKSKNINAIKTIRNIYCEFSNGDICRVIFVDSNIRGLKGDTLYIDNTLSRWNAKRILSNCAKNKESRIFVF